MSLLPIAPDASKFQRTLGETASTGGLFILVGIRHLVADHIGSQFGCALCALLAVERTRGFLSEAMGMDRPISTRRRMASDSDGLSG